MNPKPIEVRRGNDPTIPFEVTKFVDNVEVVFPLTGFTAEFRIKASASAADAAPVGSITITDAANGKLSVHLESSAVTQLGTPGTYWYRLDVIETATSDRTTVAFGDFVVKAV